MPLSGLDAALLVAAAAYLSGARRARIEPWHRLAYLGGLGTIGLALAGPLDGLADRLLSAHMLQHLLLMLVAAPLLVAGEPLRALWRLLSARTRRTLGRALATRGGRTLRNGLERPALGWILFCGTLGFWHLPRLYDWALADEVHHGIMHLSFLAGGCAFWAVVGRVGTRRGLDHGRTILYVLAAALITGLPGALLAFAGHRVYGGASDGPLPFDLTPLGDQRLAGLVMWIPMDLALFAVAAWLFSGWLRAMDRGPRSAPARGGVRG